LICNTLNQVFVGVACGLVCGVSFGQRSDAGIRDVQRFVAQGQPADR
jgi:hypothetical protein